MVVNEQIIKFETCTKAGSEYERLQSRPDKRQRLLNLSVSLVNYPTWCLEPGSSFNSTQSYNLYGVAKQFKRKGEAILIQVWGRTLGLQEVQAPRISKQSANECGKVVSPTHRPLYPHVIPLILISV